MKRKTAHKLHTHLQNRTKELHLQEYANTAEVTALCYEMVNILSSLGIPPSMLETAYQALLARKETLQEEGIQEFVIGEMDQLQARLDAYQKRGYKLDE